jgi:16S rRNA (cytidine1402-2'-O)-methyltransferase
VKPVELPDIEFPPGWCQFVATPIGNLGDMTLRGLAVLAAADVIYAEDTRHTRQLLAHFGIASQLCSYHDHNKVRQVPRILARLRQGEKVAIVSDAGTPGIADPGYLLIRSLREAGLPWSVVPGPSSVLAALLLAGYPSDRFLFVGYCPRRQGLRRRFLMEVLASTATVVMFESCHRIQATLQQIAALAQARELALVREITKRHEEVLRGSAAALLDMMQGPRLKGELVLVVSGRDAVLTSGAVASGRDST